MTLCMRCGQPMFPTDQALIPALECVGCGRLIPRTGVSHRKVSRTDLNRALRAARRAKLREAAT